MSMSMFHVRMLICGGALFVLSLACLIMCRIFTVRRRNEFYHACRCHLLWAASGADGIESVKAELREALEWMYDRGETYGWGNTSVVGRDPLNDVGRLYDTVKACLWDLNDADGLSSIADQRAVYMDVRGRLDNLLYPDEIALYPYGRRVSYLIMGSWVVMVLGVACMLFVAVAPVVAMVMDLFR